MLSSFGKILGQRSQNGLGLWTLVFQRINPYNKSMNKKIIVFLSFWILGTMSYAQKFPVRFSKPAFPILPGHVNMTALQKSILISIRNSASTPSTQLAQAVANADIVKSVFRVYPQGQTEGHALSGFIFKTIYNGKEEIFGAIAQHAVPLHNGNGNIGLSFTARVMQNDQVVDVPAKIVQMSAPSMPDVALIKFRPEDEQLLTPLTLAEQESVRGELLHTVGFGNGNLMFLSNTPLLENSLISLRFPMKGNNMSEWLGLCGSPVLNSTGEVVGTVTGAAPRKANSSYHIGYATRNLYLKSLVAAYHGDVDKASFPFILGGDKIVDLRPDEFVALIALMDENGQIIFYQGTDYKFSYSAVMEHLPKARYIGLDINHVFWKDNMLVEEVSATPARRLIYDLQEKKIIADKIQKSH